jgi:hypothetical protein
VGEDLIFDDLISCDFFEGGGTGFYELVRDGKRNFFIGGGLDGDFFADLLFCSVEPCYFDDERIVARLGFEVDCRQTIPGVGMGRPEEDKVVVLPACGSSCYFCGEFEGK